MVYYKEGLMDNLILHPNSNVRSLARLVDINISVYKYNLYFCHQEINLCLDGLEYIGKKNLSPLLKCKLVNQINQKIMILMLLHEKICAFLEQRLSKKLINILKTGLFAGAFLFIFIYIREGVSRKVAISDLRKRHKTFIKRDLLYAFVDASKKKPSLFARGILGVNMVLYTTQALCYFNIFTPSKSFKHAMDAATVGTSILAINHSNLLDGVPNFKGSRLATFVKQPAGNLTLSTAISVGFFFCINNSAITNGASPSPVTETVKGFVSDSLFDKLQILKCQKNERLFFYKLANNINYSKECATLIKCMNENLLKPDITAANPFFPNPENTATTVMKMFFISQKCAQ